MEDCGTVTKAGVFHLRTGENHKARQCWRDFASIHHLYTSSEVWSSSSRVVVGGVVFSNFHLDFPTHFSESTTTTCVSAKWKSEKKIGGCLFEENCVKSLPPSGNHKWQWISQKKSLRIVQIQPIQLVRKQSSSKRKRWILLNRFQFCIAGNPLNHRNIHNIALTCGERTKFDRTGTRCVAPRSDSIETQSAPSVIHIRQTPKGEHTLTSIIGSVPV